MQEDNQGEVGSTEFEKYAVIKISLNMLESRNVIFSKSQLETMDNTVSGRLVKETAKIINELKEL